MTTDRDDTFTVVLQVREEPEVITALDEQAAREGTTRSALVRRVLRLFLSTLPETGKDAEVQQAA